ncbi:DnaJ domain family protein [Brugia pahangi]
MSSALIVGGVGMVAIGLVGRLMLRNRVAFLKMAKTLPVANSMSKYYRGGFEPVMTRREAALVLGISPSAPAPKVKEAHKRIMIANHPDRGGSPYLAAKINEAKDKLESTRHD